MTKSSGEETVIDRLRDIFEVDDHPLTLVSQAESTDGDFVVETLVFETGDGERVRGFLARPAGPGPHPALLYIHAHGARYEIGADELLHGRRALLSPLGPEFAKRGYVTLMIEMPAFGTRAEPPESARTKAALWEGRSLAGQMLGEQAAALAWLAARGDVDESRIGVYGISMGATLGYWLAAVDARISCVAHLCCYADYRALIAAGAHDLHGIYLTIPGLLPIAGNGTIAGLIAPRPQFIAIGDTDPLTPPQAVDIALAETRAAYARAGADDRLVVHREPETGHVETAAMREAVFAFFNDTL
jgi:dienelactone hydrolase